MTDGKRFDDWLFERREQQRRNGHEPRELPPNVHPLDPARASSFARRALEAELDELARTPEGQRNDALNEASFSLAQLVAAGALEEQPTRDALARTARSIGLDDSEIGKTIASGFKAGREQPRDLSHVGQASSSSSGIKSTPDAPFGEIDVEAQELEATELDAFWRSRELIAHIEQYARSRRTSPWAVLGVVLARMVTATQRTLVLPPIVGGEASLNLFVGLVGVSGSGKGAAERVAADAVEIGRHVKTLTTGSGEGIGHAYKVRKQRDKPAEWVDDDHAVLFSVPEIDTLSALGARSGATLMPELRRGWSGESLGFQYADATRRLLIPAHEYRMCLVAGIQPARAKTLLDDADGGTPQRFVWLPTTDRHAPETPPETPDRWVWKQPSHTRYELRDAMHGRYWMPVCELARKTIDDAAFARLRGEVDALDGHLLLCQLKVAAALALADSRVDVRDEDWQLADIIIRKSSSVRASIAGVLERDRAARNEARGKADAAREVIIDDAKIDRARARVSRAILRRLSDVESVSHNELRHDFASRDRLLFDETIAVLIETKQVRRIDVDQGVHYALG